MTGTARSPPAPVQFETRPNNVVSEPLNTILETSRENSASNRSTCRGSSEGYRSATGEERLMALEGTILTLNSMFDRMLENNSKADRILEELMKERGGGEVAPNGNATAVPLPPLAPLPNPCTSEAPSIGFPPPAPSQTTYATPFPSTRPPYSQGFQHLPTFGINSMGFLHPTTFLESIVSSPRFTTSLRPNLGPTPQFDQRPVPQFDQRNPSNQAFRTNLGYNANPVTQNAIPSFLSTPVHGGPQLGVQLGSSSGNQPPVRFKIPQYNGDMDVEEWRLRVNNYFNYYGVFDGDKIIICSGQLQGTATHWFDWLMKIRGDIIGWEEFCQAIKMKFGPSQFTDHVIDLKLLKQEGAVQDYTRVLKNYPKM